MFALALGLRTIHNVILELKYDRWWRYSWLNWSLAVHCFRLLSKKHGRWTTAAGHRFYALSHSYRLVL